MKITKLNVDGPLWVKILVWVIFILLACGIIFGVACLSGLLIMLLWNATLPTIIVGFSYITFWQAVGIDLLVGLLFGGLTKVAIKSFIN